MAKTSIGLDIGSSIIRVVELEKDKERVKLRSLASIASPQPGMNGEGDVELEAVASTIKSLLTAAKIEGKDVVVALPESKVFTRVIDDLPYLTDKELSSSITYAAEEFIPLPLTDVNLNWQILYRSNPKDKNPRTVVFLIASPKTLINKYVKVLTYAGVRPKALETETMGATRSLVGPNPFAPTTIIIQIGSSTTDLTIVSKGLIWLTRSLSTGGLALTRAIAQHFNFEMSQAEEYKKVYGMLEDQLDGKVYEVLKPLIDIIAQESKRVIQAFAEKYPTSQIKRVVLSGGGAKMPGIVIYFASLLGLEVQEADPWYTIIKDQTLATKLSQDAPAYSVAVGLALREE
ncbi:type IV pilus assembly protein PilM [Candidatus Daviesbacteria bacterium]|nr:type IV pilus assembly protein PilM [Candidatus Daviesbacteria bacterium]